MLFRSGAEVVALPHAPGGGIALNALLADLAGREVNELHVEAGACLTGAWLKAELADELLLYMAATLLGEGPGIATLGRLTALDEGCQLQLTDIRPVGADLRLRLQSPGSLPAHWPARAG